MSLLPSIFAPALCSTFEKESCRIWCDYGAAYRSGIVVGEETISDIFLWNIQKAHPQNVTTFPINKMEEGKIGADWEWWLTDENLWFGLLIQAKRLDPKSHKYRNIRHQSRTSKNMQIDLLIQTARRKRIDPLYFFYNYAVAPKISRVWNCFQVLGLQSQLGCMMAHASVVKQQLGRGGAGFSKFSKISLPVRCLVCCPSLSGTGQPLPNRASEVVKRLKSFAGDIETSEIANGNLRPEPPPYVQQLMKTPLNKRGSMIDKLKREGKIGRIGSLTVIDESAGKEKRLRGAVPPLAAPRRP